MCSKADKAAFIVGRSAGSGFLTCENNVGIWIRSDVITGLSVLLADSKRDRRHHARTSTHKDQQKALRLKVQTGLPSRA